MERNTVASKESTRNVANFINEFVHKESFSGILLFVSAVLALIAANSPLTAGLYDKFLHLEVGFTIANFEFVRSVHFWINDALMALFFLMIGLEVKREILVGELSTFEKALSPIFASIGGMVIPILIFLYINWGSGYERGFAIPMGTDTAFALGVLMLLGSRVPIKLKIFLVTLAVADDVGAILVIAIFYSSEISYLYLFLALAIAAVLMIFNQIGIKSLTPYLLGGLLLWYFFYRSGFHATIAGVVLAFIIPIHSKISGLGFLEHLRLAVNVFYSNAPKQEENNEQVLLNAKQNNALEIIAKAYDQVQSPLVRLEHYLHPLSGFFIMPLFAFANAGVQIHGGIEFNELFWGIAAGLFIGKPLGIFTFTYLLDFFGISRKPSNLTWAQIFGCGLVASIGFTMSILIANLGFEGATAEQATLSVLLTSFVATIVSMLYFIIFSPKNNISSTS